MSSEDNEEEWTDSPKRVRSEDETVSELPPTQVFESTEADEQLVPGKTIEATEVAPTQAGDGPAETFEEQGRDNLKATQPMSNDPEENNGLGNVETNGKVGSKRRFRTILEFVESEIWARDEIKWKYPTLSGFAADAVALDLAEDVKAAKKAIREAFETADFSAERVIKSFFEENNLDALEMETEDAVTRVMQAHGGGIVRDVAKNVVMALKYPQVSDGATSSSDSNDSDSDRDFEEEDILDETTKKTLSLLAPPQILKMAARAHSLDTTRVPNIRLLNHTKILSALEGLLDASEAVNVDAREAKKLKAAADKRINAVVPLNYKPSEKVSRAVKDLLEMSIVAFETSPSWPSGLKCFETADKLTFLVEHPQALKRMRYFGADRLVKYAWASFARTGAAYAICKGFPFPGLDRAFTLKGRRDENSRVNVLFRVDIGERHASIEKEQAGSNEDRDDDLSMFGIDTDAILASNELVHVYESCAVAPVLLRFQDTRPK